MSIFGELWDKGKELAGSGIDDLGELAGDGLDAAGLHGAARWVEAEGDKAGYALGADVPALQLGQTDDPAELVHGDPAAMRSSVSGLRNFSEAFGETAAGMRGLDSSHWTGAAADAFRAKYAPHPAKWQDAADAAADAAEALASYAAAVESAQGQARRAISLYQQGQQATATAAATYNRQVTAYNTAAWAYNARLQAGTDPGTRPIEPGPFTDPGAQLRDQAQQILAQARAARDAAAASSTAKITAATSLAPAEPSFWSRVGDDFLDTFKAGSLANVSLSAGVLEGTADIVKFARSVNPVDPWNLTHPAEYVASASGTLAGLVSDALNPVDLVRGLVGTGWGSDPAQALGKLVPNVALTLLTDGGGAAEDAGASAAEDVAAQGVQGMPGLEDGAAGTGKFSDTDRAAVWDYTTNDGYTTINGYLRNPDGYTPAEAATIQGRADRVSSALAKLPPRPGVTYRGANFPDSVLFKYKEGMVVTEKGFTSTSTDPAIASGNFEGNASMIITGKFGRDISELSKYPEKEVLYDRGTSFYVLGKFFDLETRKWTIIMREAK